jgi:hypothetical protein
MHSVDAKFLNASTARFLFHSHRPELFQAPTTRRAQNVNAIAQKWPTQTTQDHCPNPGSATCEKVILVSTDRRFVSFTLGRPLTT